MKFIGNRLLILITIVVLTFSLSGCGLLNPPDVIVVEEEDEAFYEVLNELLNNHYSQPERKDLIDGAIEGMVASLDDPFTRYFDYEELIEYQTGFGESYIGIGVTVRYEDSVIVIEDVNLVRNYRLLNTGVSVGGAIYDVATGKITPIDC